MATAEIVNQDSPPVASIKRDPNRFYTLVRDWGTAVRIAGGYNDRGRNGAYYTVREGFLVVWDAKPLED